MSRPEPTYEAYSEAIVSTMNDSPPFANEQNALACSVAMAPANQAAAYSHAAWQMGVGRCAALRDLSYAFCPPYVTPAGSSRFSYSACWLGPAQTPTYRNADLAASRRAVDHASVYRCAADRCWTTPHAGGQSCATTANCGVVHHRPYHIVAPTEPCCVHATCWAVRYFGVWRPDVFYQPPPPLPCACSGRAMLDIVAGGRAVPPTATVTPCRTPPDLVLPPTQPPMHDVSPAASRLAALEAVYGDAACWKAEPLGGGGGGGGALPLIAPQRSRGLDPSAVAMMRVWYVHHVDHPYPPPGVVAHICARWSVSPDQVKKWFANRRMRTGFGGRRRKL